MRPHVERIEGGSDWWRARLRNDGLTLVIVNMCFLCATSPLYPDSPQAQMVNTSSLVFSALYLAEIVWNLLSKGPRAFVSTPWNWVECGLVALGFTSFFLPGARLPTLASLRVVRLIFAALQHPKAHRVAKILRSAVRGVSAALFFGFLYVLVFAFLGLELWMGVMAGTCAAADGTATGLLCAPGCDIYPADTPCVTAFGEGCDASRLNSPSGGDGVCMRGANPDFGSTSFDNIGAAMLTSFMLVVEEGWVDTMYAIWGTWGVKPLVSTLFVFHRLFGQWAILQLTLAVLVVAFTRAEQAEEEEESQLEGTEKKEGSNADDEGSRSDCRDHGGVLNAAVAPHPRNKTESLPSPVLSPSLVEPVTTPVRISSHSSRHSVEVQASAQVEAVLPFNTFLSALNFVSSCIRAIITHPLVALFFLLLLCANGIVLALPYAGMSKEFAWKLEISNIVFVACFVVELILRVSAMGTRSYFRHTTNVFDALVVAASVIDVVCVLLIPSYSSSGVSVLRLLRVFRVLRLLPPVARLLGVMSSILPAFIAVVTFLFAIAFMMAIIGMQAFGGSYDAAVSAGLLPDVPKFNFNTLWLSLLTVFQLICTEDWKETFTAHLAAFGPAVVLFFVPTILFGRSIFLGIMLGVVLEQLEHGARHLMTEAQHDHRGRGLGLVHSHGNDAHGEVSLQPPEHQHGNKHHGHGTQRSLATGAPHGTRKRHAVTASHVHRLAAHFLRRLWLNVKESLDIFTAISRNFKHHPLCDHSTTNMHGSQQLATLHVSEPFGSSAHVPSHDIHPTSTWLPAGHETGPHGAMHAAVEIIAPADNKDPSSSPPSIDRMPLSPIPHAAPMTLTIIADEKKPDTKLIPTASSSNKSMYFLPSIGHKPASLDATLPMVPTSDLLAAALPPTDSSGPPGEEQRTFLRSMSPLPLTSTPHTPTIEFFARHNGALRNVFVEATGDNGASVKISLSASGVVKVQNRESGDVSGHEVVDFPLLSALPKWVSRAVNACVSVQSEDAALLGSLRERIDYAVAQAHTVHYAVKVAPTLAAAEMQGLSAVAAPTPTLMPLSFAASTGHALRIAWLRFRLAVTRVVCCKLFGWISLAVILLSSINLALDEPGVSNDLQMYVDSADVFIAFFFAAELAAGVVARGVLLDGPDSYFCSNWRLLDAFVVAVSIASLAVANRTVKSLRAIRALRSLRVLRAVGRFPSLRVTVDAMLMSLPRARHFALLLASVLVIFAILGLQLFAGAAYACNDPDPVVAGVGAGACIGYFNVTGAQCAFFPTDDAAAACSASPWGAPFPRVWSSSGVPNFDTFGNALLTAWELMTGVNWSALTVLGLSAVGDGLPQVLYASPAAALYYVAAFFILHQVLLDVLIGLIVTTYMELRDDASKVSLLTPAQRVWVANMRIILGSKLPAAVVPPTSHYGAVAAVRRAAFTVATSRGFDVFIVLCIVANMAFLALRHMGQSATAGSAQVVSSAVFTALFAAEACIKIVGTGPRYYWWSWHNRFDLLLAVGSIAGTIADSGTIGSLLRVFRILRIMRLLRRSIILMRMLNTLILSLPGFLNVLLVVAVCLFIFAVIGMNVFAGIRTGSGLYLDENANFNSFGASVITLIRCFTGETFNGIMHDLTVQPPYCVPGDDGNCGVSLASAALYFVIFYNLIALVFLNFLVALLLEGYKAARTEPEVGVLRVTRHEVEDFAAAWRACDPAGVMALPVSLAAEILARVPPPLGTCSCGGGRGEPNATAAAAAADREEAERLLCILPLVPVLTDAYPGAPCVQFHALLEALISHGSARPALPGAVSKVELAAETARRALPFHLASTVAAKRT